MKLLFQSNKSRIHNYVFLLFRCVLRALEPVNTVFSFILNKLLGHTFP